ncbi:hypothetical protein TW65_05227 [Stemphylium lycopersici]|uniref:Uncharacterized protein n=1 Tax=Stemphylium lycopersici TaxID=183478 RepID=A0A364MV95_STELY|nr:hypothetical protein TW65_05227 [Stemphylium lycopersici]RAR03878.1 hypothetical protein DDE83_008066 [Stemphylium lycopersici]
MMFMLTLSSSVVVSKEVVLQEEPQLQRYVADQGSSNASAPIKLSPVQDTYLHTIGSFIFNVSGSIWVSDSCMIVPYEIPWEIEDTGRLGDQTWRAETNAFNIDYGYVPMVMTGKTSLNISYDVANIPDALANNTTRNSKSLGFKTCSEDSCKIQLQIPIDDQYLMSSAQLVAQDTFMHYGGILWTNLTRAYIPWEKLVEEHGNMPKLAPVGISGGRLTGAFNVSEFEKLQQLVPQNMIDCVQLNGLAFDHDWTRYLAIREENSGYNGESTMPTTKEVPEFLESPNGAVAGSTTKRAYEADPDNDFQKDAADTTFTDRTKVFAMNETATSLSFAIILVLIFILIALIISLEVVYPSHCPQRNVECLADVLAIIAGSDRLIELIQKNVIENLEKSDAKTKLV